MTKIVKITRKRLTKEERLKAEKQFIKTQNKKFEKSTKAEKRVMIAEDVIIQIKSRRIEPNVGTYFEVYKKGDFLKLERNGLRNQIVAPDVSCSCCQLGGMFSACVRMNGDYMVKEDEAGDNDVELDHIQTMVRKFFSPKQMVMVECAFESKDIQQFFTFADDNYTACVDYRVNLAAKKLGKTVHDLTFSEMRSTTDAEAMIAICKNIIDNKGTFIP